MGAGAHSPPGLGNDDPKENAGDLKGRLHGQQSCVPGNKVRTIAKYRPILEKAKRKPEGVVAMCVLV